MKRIFYFGVSVIILVGASCRSAKKIQKAISNSKIDTAHSVLIVESPKEDSAKLISDIFSKVEKNRINFTTLSAKLKVNYEGGDGRDNEFTCFLRMQKDSAIWVRVEASALLGIEALRILITRDSVKVLNKLDKVITLRSVSYLQETAKIPLDFKTLQDLLVGNPVYLDSNIVFYRKEANAISILSLGKLFKNYLTLNNTDYTLKHSKLDDVDVMRARTCDLTYGDYSNNFSTYRKISIAEKSKLDIEFVFKQFNFNEVLSFPFTIPKNYKRK
jgi:hypothetical protein